MFLTCKTAKMRNIVREREVLMQAEFIGKHTSKLVQKNGQL